MILVCAFLLAASAAFALGSVAARLPRIRCGKAGATMPVGGALVASIVITMLFCFFPALGGPHDPSRPTWAAGAVMFVLPGFFVTLCGLRLAGAPGWLLSAATAIACGSLVAQGLQIESVKFPFRSDFIPLGAMSWLVTFLWLFAVTLIVGRASELPGLHFGVVALSSLTMLLLTFLSPQARDSRLVVCLAATVAGACGGVFLPSLRSSTCSAGQAGGLTLGFCLAIVTVLGALKNTAFLILLLPLLLVGAPLIDFSFAMRRAMRRTMLRSSGEFSFMQAREPLHRALIRHGWRPLRVTFLYLALEAYLCALALLLVLMIRVHFTVKLLVLAGFGAMGWLFFTSIVKLLARPGREIASGSSAAVSPCPASSPPSHVELHNLRISAVNMEQAVAQIETFILSREPHMVVTSDASTVVRSQDDEQLHRIINEADLVTPDGIGVIWSARFLDLPLYERVSGVDLAVRLAELAAQKGYSMFLFGAAPGVAEEAASRLQQRFPGLRIAGTRDGFFSAEEEPVIVRSISAARPDMLLVAFGIPKQEKWIKRHLQSLQVPVCIGVGGSFDVYAGRVARAPAWMQRLGLEWLFRTARDPRRLGRALLLPRLVVMTIKRRLTKKTMVNG